VDQISALQEADLTGKDAFAVHFGSNTKRAEKTPPANSLRVALRDPKTRFPCTRL
jgi:hypothetical protein